MEKPITHVYCIFRLKGGGIVRNVWTRAQVDAHAKQYSQAYKSGKKDTPWFTNWRAMAIKTVIKDTINRGRLPMSESIQQIVEREAQLEAGSVVTDSRSAVIEQALRLEHEPPAATECFNVGIIVTELADAKNLGQVSAIREKWTALASTEDEQFEVEQLCKEREDSIRGARSK